MNIPASTQTIMTGVDPRGLPEFNAIREEINKVSHPTQPELNWKLVESLALTIFRTNGVDLHTVTYYTLARTRVQGLSGFCEGTELLAAMIHHEWDAFWPPGDNARTDMLDWFNTRTGNILRQQLSYTNADLPLLSRIECALQLICDKLQQVQLQRQPRVENLLYFVQNTSKRLEPPALDRSEASSAAITTLVYAPESAVYTAEQSVVPLPPLPDMKVKVHGVADAKISPDWQCISKSFTAGMICCAALAAVLWWWLIHPIQQQLAQVNKTTQGAATIWLATPELNSYARRLQSLLETSPLQTLETGKQMMHVADARWPGSQQQLQATNQWIEMLKARAQSSPQLRGWLQTRQNLRSFADLMMQREKEGLTLSYIKNVIWQAERSLGQETPVEFLLSEYQDARAQGKGTEVLETQINERLNGVLTRWLLLKYEPATEITTGKKTESTN